MKQAIAVRFDENGKEEYFDPAGLEVHAGIMSWPTRPAARSAARRSGRLLPRPNTSCPGLCAPCCGWPTAWTSAGCTSARTRTKRHGGSAGSASTRHGLEMKLVKGRVCPRSLQSHFYFTADGRVDFRELVKDLASTFHMRIELRQNRRPGREQDDGGAWACAARPLLQPLSAGLPAGIHPDGQRTGPLPQPPPRSAAAAAA